MPLSAKYLWLGVPLVGLAELAGQLYFSHRFPTVAEWKKLEPEVARIKRADDLLVVAPEWEDPIARSAFGDRLMPARDSARPDDGGYQRALEIGALGRSSAELADWPITEQHESGGFVLRFRKNPHYTRIQRVLIDHADPPELEVNELAGGAPKPCTFVENGSPSQGGLHAPPMFPRRRFRCGAGEASFVGLTIVEDENYLPHRCLWANATSGELELTFKAVTLGAALHLGVGLPYFRARDTDWAPVVISSAADGVQMGRIEHHAEQGWRTYDIATGAQTGHVSDVIVRVSASDPRAREVCLYADVR